MMPLKYFKEEIYIKSFLSKLRKKYNYTILYNLYIVFKEQII